MALEKNPVLPQVLALGVYRSNKTRTFISFCCPWTRVCGRAKIPTAFSCFAFAHIIRLAQGMRKTDWTVPLFPGCRKQPSQFFSALFFQASPPLFPGGEAFSSAYSASACTALAAVRPETKISTIALPPRRFPPWIPPVTSPAAYRPSMASPSSFRTWRSASTFRPPMV